MCGTALGYSMAIGDGDIVEIEFTARTKQSGILIDTTKEKVAEEEEVDTEGQKWGPRKIVIGEQEGQNGDQDHKSNVSFHRFY